MDDELSGLTWFLLKVTATVHVRTWREASHFVISAFIKLSGIHWGLVPVFFVHVMFPLVSPWEASRRLEIKSHMIARFRIFAELHEISRRPAKWRCSLFPKRNSVVWWFLWRHLWGELQWRAGRVYWYWRTWTLTILRSREKA